MLTSGTRPALASRAFQIYIQYVDPEGLIIQVARWGNSLAIRLPAAIVEALELREGDDVEIRIAGQRTFDVERDKAREQALERIRALRKPIPPGWKFDREQANER